jgi:hypothetical protein
MDGDGAGGGDSVTEAVAFARRFVQARYPHAEAALLSGSQSRGEGGPRSDYDVVLLFPALPEGAWRERSDFEGAEFEVFAHDPGTLSYFCRAMVARSGVPAVPEMVAEGIPVLGEGGVAIAGARALATRALAAGPPPVDPAMLHSRLCALTELVQALANCRPGASLTAVGGALYPVLADFALRSAGRWSASVKRMPAALEAMDPALAARFAAAFDSLFARGDPEPVLALADSILEAHGGRPPHGFRIASPPNWRD